MREDRVVTLADAEAAMRRKYGNPRESYARMMRHAERDVSAEVMKADLRDRWAASLKNYEQLQDRLSKPPKLRGPLSIFGIDTRTPNNT